MNYVWDWVIRAAENGMPRKDLRFTVAEVYSPYMELSPENINNTDAGALVEMNPYYRYDEIFRDLFQPDNDEDQELRKTLFDITVHFLVDIDLQQGMNKTEYYYRFILRDIRNGLFGPAARKNIALFSHRQQQIIAFNLYRLYHTGQALYLLENTMSHIFPESLVYANYEVKNEVILFLNYEKTGLLETKLAAILELFLPLQFRTEIYWAYHFGIIGNPEAMQNDKIAMY
ncbi:MAG TPA: iron-dependent peroxidase [Firmicutes bacterium]|jgi:hypothetical protein|nr:iron-dependent peroxidase [Bacillota bacterium]